MPNDLPTLLAAAADIRSGRLRPVDLVERCLAQIDAHETRIRAWVMVDAEGARDAARRAGDEIARGEYRGRLHGIPIGIKDIVDVAGWPTLAGSSLHAGHRAQRDATVVARLRNAGAVLLGKTVTTEFASFDPPVTRNPWNVARTPGGSSSGSAAAVALGMCLGAIGSQTGGSITRPASYCGVAGCKPTFGRVSSQGVVPLSRHMDHVGPIARSVGDLAAILEVIAGYDPLDATTVDVPVDHYVDRCRDAAAPRLGLVDDAYFSDGLPRSVAAALAESTRRFEQSGAMTGMVKLPGSFAQVTALHRRMMGVEAAEYHQPMFEKHRDRYGPNIASLIEEGPRVTAIAYAAALVHRRQLQRDLLTSFADYDALVTPATTSTAPGIETTGDPKFNSPWSYVGYPTVSFPCGLADDGLPLAVQIVGRPFEEARLLSAAAWCERTLNFEQRPAV
ncbi:MAG TPA: amidase [Pirellulales bacterium]|nr:amidase [Pirellulales bacterium]